MSPRRISRKRRASICTWPASLAGVPVPSLATGPDDRANPRRTYATFNKNAFDSSVSAVVNFPSTRRGAEQNLVRLFIHRRRGNRSLDGQRDRRLRKIWAQRRCHLHLVRTGG